MKPILVFDVNETLLNLNALDPIFTHIFNDPLARQQWFSQFIHNAFVSIITDSYKPFGKIGMAALDMVAERKGVKVTDEDKARIVNGIKSLPPHPEVSQALKKLQDKGFRIVALTNSTEEVANAQIASAGLTDYFEHIFSADSVKRLKPAEKAYKYVSKQLNIEKKDLMLIAAHAWDIAGAMKAGLSTAFIARPGAVLDPLALKPTYVGRDLVEIFEQIKTL